MMQDFNEIIFSEEPTGEEQEFQTPKPKKLYSTIGEVAAMFDLEVSTLRYWEKVFPHLSPRRTSRGTRSYSEKDIEAVAVVYRLLKVRGLKIEAAQRELSEDANPHKRRTEAMQKLYSVRGELELMRKALLEWERQSLLRKALAADEENEEEND